MEGTNGRKGKKEGDRKEGRKQSTFKKFNMTLYPLALSILFFEERGPILDLEIF